MRLRDSNGHCGIIVLLVIIALVALILLAGGYITGAMTEFWAAYSQKKQAHGEAGTETQGEVKHEGGIGYVG